MEEIMIRFVASKERIYSILEMFTPYLNSLASGMVEGKQMAAKFYNYGNVIEIDEKSKIVGFAAFYCNDQIKKTAFLSMIAVLPCARRCGYGKVLMNEVMKISRGHGMEYLKLEVRKGNINAIRLYRSLGFQMLNEESAASCFMQKDLHKEGR